MVLAPASSSAWPRASRPRSRRADGLRRWSRTRIPASSCCFGQVRLPGVRRHDRRARAAAVLVQQPARRLPGMRRPGPPARTWTDLVVPGPGRACATARSRPGPARPRPTICSAAGRPRRSTSARPRHALAGAARGDARADPARLGRQPVELSFDDGLRATARRAVRGRAATSAALARDRERLARGGARRAT